MKNERKAKKKGSLNVKVLQFLKFILNKGCLKYLETYKAENIGFQSFKQKSSLSQHKFLGEAKKDSASIHFRLRLMLKCNL